MVFAKGTLKALLVADVVTVALVALVAVVAVPVKSPVKLVAVTTPVILIPPVPLIVLLLRSKFPPSCGVVSSTTFCIQLTYSLQFCLNVPVKLRSPTTSNLY